MDKTATLTDVRLEIRFPYSDGMVSRIKQDIPSIRWDRDNRCWWITKSPTSAKLVRTFANAHQFTLDGKIVELSDTISQVTKADRTPLYDFQKTGVDFIHRNMGTCLLADQMGVGKTIQALFYLKEAGLSQVLVVCPASVTYKWKAEAERWVDMEAEVLATGKQKIGDVPIHIMSYAIMTARAKELSATLWDLVIFDECHQIKSQAAKRTLGAQLLTAKRKLFLSGTPLLNRPIEMFTTLNMIDSLQFDNYWKFAKRYCAAYKHPRLGFWVVDGQSNLDELRKRLEPIMLRRTKQEVLKDLPDMTRSIVPVAIDNKTEYRQVLSDLKAWLRKNGKTNRATALTKIGYLRQVTGKGKITSIVELAQEILASNPTGKLVVYAHFKDTVSAIRDALKEYGVDTIVGEDSQTKRQATVASFQTKQIPRVLVISSAGGEGIDLFRADSIIFAELPWNPSGLEQAESRLHRNGQKLPVTSYIMLAQDTIDTHVYNLINHKAQVIGELIDTDSIETQIMDKLLEDV